MRRADQRDAFLPNRAEAFSVPDDSGDVADQPVITLVHAVSGELVELLGPMFWAALIVLFIQAALLTRG